MKSCIIPNIFVKWFVGSQRYQSWCGSSTRKGLGNWKNHYLPNLKLELQRWGYTQLFPLSFTMCFFYIYFPVFLKIDIRHIQETLMHDSQTPSVLYKVIIANFCSPCLHSLTIAYTSASFVFPVYTAWDAPKEDGVLHGAALKPKAFSLAVQ